jgi:hypothetical protein
MTALAWREGASIRPSGKQSRIVNSAIAGAPVYRIMDDHAAIPGGDLVIPAAGFAGGMDLPVRGRRVS